MGDYQRLQTEAEAEVPLNPTSYSRQDVYYKKSTSLCHSVAFVSSIAFCLFVVLFFIWGLPCDVSPCQTAKSTSVSWDKTLVDLELKGRMHLVAGNIIAIFRIAKWGRQTDKFSQKAGGVIALNGRTGEDLYWISMSVLPKFLDCSLSDLINGNVKACIIVGESGYLSAFNPFSGIVIWKLTAREGSPQPVDIDVPLVVADMDSDGHVDFVTLSRFTKGHHRLAFISGRTGVIIKEPLLSADCNQVNGLKFGPARTSLIYTCSNELASKTLEYHFSRSIPGGRVLVPDDEFNRFVQSNSSSGEHYITVNNTGECPTKCFASVNITDSRNHSIWTYASNRAYAMNPLPLRFKHSITGFLFKLWNWQSLEKTKNGMAVQSIKEQTFIYTFHKDESSPLNVSQTDIVQICFENECQPYLSFQTQSALIADLNDDGSQDLISYYVTYKPDRFNGLSDGVNFTNWTLESRIQVIRLEVDLPKFFESISSE